MITELNTLSYCFIEQHDLIFEKITAAKSARGKYDAIPSNYLDSSSEYSGIRIIL